MKPCSGDIRHKVLITGDELRELQRHAYGLVEAFGLDRKILAYKGTRPITLYRWDLECLMDMIESELGNPREYPDKGAPEYLALDRLGGGSVRNTTGTTATNDRRIFRDRSGGGAHNKRHEAETPGSHLAKVPWSRPWGPWRMRIENPSPWTEVESEP